MWAQVVQPAGVSGEGFIGIPEFTSTETGIPFFSQDIAGAVDKAFRDARAAIANCDRAAYDLAREGLSRDLNLVRRRPYDPARYSRDSRDLGSSEEALEKFPAFPESCKPAGGQVATSRFEVYAVGGGLGSFNPGGYVTGVDTFFGSGNFLISNQSGGTSNPTAFAGARARFDAVEQYFFEESFHRILHGSFKKGASRTSSPSLFLETGIQTGFGAQSFIQPFQSITSTPQGFGSNTVNENFQIPILAGVTLPIAAGAPGALPILVDVYGGITFDSWTHTLQGGESGAPGGPGFFGQNRRFTVDPTVGVGVRVPVGDPKAGLPVILGLNAEFQFRPGSVVTAPSQNFPSETYYGTLNPTTNMLLMARIGIPLGGR
jgi:hypothetical protein